MSTSVPKGEPDIFKISFTPNKNPNSEKVKSVPAIPLVTFPPILYNYLTIIESLPHGVSVSSSLT